MKKGYIYMVINNSDPIWCAFDVYDLVICISRYGDYAGINRPFGDKSICQQRLRQSQVIEIGKL